MQTPQEIADERFPEIHHSKTDMNEYNRKIYLEGLLKGMLFVVTLPDAEREDMIKMYKEVNSKN